MRQKMISFCVLAGLGFCWSAEEMLTFCISYNASGTDSSMYLYGFYMPLYTLCSIAFIMFPTLEKLLSRLQVVACLVVLGVFGILIVALFPQSMLAVLFGVALFAAAAIPLNYVWILSISHLGGKIGKRVVLATAGMTCISTLLWQLPARALFFLSAVYMIGSLATWLPVASLSAQDAISKAMHPSKQKAFAGFRKPAALIGMGVIAMGFGFLQYTAYHFSSCGAFVNETVTHAVSFVLLALVVFVLKDTDHTLSMKLSATLMLFAYVTFSTLHGSEGLATLIAAGTEGMFELALVLILLALIERGVARPGFLFGGYGLLLGVSHLLGSSLSVVEHVIMPSDSYSAIGLLLVALLIVTAVWLLNDKTIAEFLWSDSNSNVEGEAEKADEKEKIREMAETYSLTPREAEVLELLGKGRSSSFIAEHFCVSNNTIRSHVLHIYSKLDVHSRQEVITLLDEWEPHQT